MKGLSLFYDNKSIRLHPNAYTENGFGKAIPPFVILGKDASAKTFSQTLQEMLNHSQTDVPFQMITAKEREAYREAFGTSKMGIGVHLTLEGEKYTITPINKRGLFGTPIEIQEDGVIAKIQELIGWTNLEFSMK